MKDLEGGQMKELLEKLMNLVADHEKFRRNLYHKIQDLYVMTDENEEQASQNFSQICVLIRKIADLLEGEYEEKPNKNH